MKITRLAAPRPLPATPPASVQAKVDEAAVRVDELAAIDRELHFETDAATGRLVIQVRSLDGTVIREVTGSEALDVMSGLVDV